MSNLPLIFTKINADFLTTEQVENDLSSSKTRTETTKRQRTNSRRPLLPRICALSLVWGGQMSVSKTSVHSQPTSSCSLDKERRIHSAIFFRLNIQAYKHNPPAVPFTGRQTPTVLPFDPNQNLLPSFQTFSLLLLLILPVGRLPTTNPRIVPQH